MRYSPSADSCSMAADGESGSFTDIITKMADDRTPPKLDENADDDLFASAIEVSS